PIVINEVHLHLGLLGFFTGDWDTADRWLSLVNEAEANPRCRSWAKLMRGSMAGIRGLDASRARSLLESAIRVLELMGDDLGVAVAFGNMGEMTWKLGQLEEALIQLSRAATISEAYGNSIVAADARRNLVHCCLKLYGAFSFELEEALDKLRPF